MSHMCGQQVEAILYQFMTATLSFFHSFSQYTWAPQAQQAQLGTGAINCWHPRSVLWWAKGFSLGASCVQMDQINMHNAQMVRHIAEVEGHSALLKGQLQECESEWNKAIADNVRLHQQVSLLNSKAHVSIQFLSINQSIIHWIIESLS